ncbi:hypothetical protein [Thermoactinomyces mirandus]|uniref:Uncharacterized protein n=1 Tax=Thermoactinomyces mirandus TaxID=2756294 RepID=A0A7W1XUQ2_9BACL|nr:hypothetical protein [Thermoactinomyces mirandus]MBA4603639.1 hypothetical protein [Thermoactinomyces mirandus]
MNKHHYFYISIGLFLFSAFIRPIGEDGFNWGDVLFHAMGLPIWSNEASFDGLHYSVIFYLLLAISSWTAIYRLSNWSFTRFIVYTILANILISPVIQWSKEEFWGSYNDLRSIEYHSSESNCHADNHEDKVQKIQCTIVLTNHSDHTLYTYIKIPKDIHFGDASPWPVEFHQDQYGQPYQLEPGKQTLNIASTLPTGHSQSLLGDWSNIPLILYYDKKAITLRAEQPVFLP